MLVPLQCALLTTHPTSKSLSPPPLPPPPNNQHTPLASRILIYTFCCEGKGLSQTMRKGQSGLRREKQDQLQPFLTLLNEKTGRGFDHLGIC